MMLDNAVSRGEWFCVKKLSRRHIWQEATSLQQRRQQQLQQCGTANWHWQRLHRLMPYPGVTR